MASRRLKRICVALVSVLVLVVVGGYATAWHARPAIEQEIRTYVLTHEVDGYDLSGHVPPEKIGIYSRVNAPFVVTGTFAVPRDVHASYYETRYLVLPWARYVLSKDAHHAV